ncbi:hypothetical protein JCGZ_04907 [Jatropha curcas]|uniref:Uncharacterized protein n=1 Tax=Jatropha curcas TaxID=180498 RepID=A0A067KXX4_JATCU|nr:hypothetical protein JCGZ_04907 [Jatropha curcas]
MTCHTTCYPPSPFSWSRISQLLRWQQQRDKRVRRVLNFGASNTVVVVGKPEHGPGASFSFILDCIDWTAQGMLETHLVSPYQMSPPGCTHVFIDDYNEMCQLYEVAPQFSGGEALGRACICETLPRIS